MRYWLEYLMNNTQAYNDFTSDMLERERTLEKSISTALIKDDIKQATSLAHEARVYENIRKKIQAEFNERTSQATYDQQNKGGST